MWTLLTLVVVGTALIGVDTCERVTGRRRFAILSAMVLGTAPYCIRLANTLRDNLANPPEWDFMGFWLHARSAVTGLDFYRVRVE